MIISVLGLMNEIRRRLMILDVGETLFLRFFFFFFFFEE